MQNGGTTLWLIWRSWESSHGIRRWGKSEGLNGCPWNAVGARWGEVFFWNASLPGERRNKYLFLNKPWKCIYYVAWTVLINEMRLKLWLEIPIRIFTNWKQSHGFCLIFIQGQRRIGLSWWFSSKESTCNAGDVDLIPGPGRSLGVGSGHQLQYSCLENPMKRRSLVGYSAWGRKDLATEHRHQHGRIILNEDV